jgi:hypothetical protein
MPDAYIRSFEIAARRGSHKNSQQIMGSKIRTKSLRSKPLMMGQGLTRPADIKADGHLYLQVARALKEEIVGGVYPVGTQLPTEDELCERFSVSRYTVREALRRLREDNLVSSRQGAGTVVIPRLSLDSYIQDVMLQSGPWRWWSSTIRWHAKPGSRAAASGWRSAASGKWKAQRYRCVGPSTTSPGSSRQLAGSCNATRALFFP